MEEMSGISQVSKIVMSLNYKEMIETIKAERKQSKHLFFRDWRKHIILLFTTAAISIHLKPMVEGGGGFLARMDGNWRCYR